MSSPRASKFCCRSTRHISTCLRAQAVLTVAQQTVQARQLVSDQVTELEKNKIKSGLDVSFANVNLAQAQLLLIQAQNDVAGFVCAALRRSRLRRSANLSIERRSLCRRPRPPMLRPSFSKRFATARN